MSKGDILIEQPRSAKTNRTLDDIAAGKPRKKVWKQPANKVKRKRAADRIAVRPSHSGAVVAPQPARTTKSLMSSAIASIEGVRRTPMPKQITAQLATLVEQAATGDQWLHEQKFDGYRMFCRIRSDDVQFVAISKAGLRNYNRWYVMPNNSRREKRFWMARWSYSTPKA